jgi:hypothetical protein
MLRSDFHRINVDAIHKPPASSVSVRSQDHIIAGHHAFFHLTILVESPVFKPITSRPLVSIRGILEFIPELDGNTIVSKREQLFP